MLMEVLLWNLDHARCTWDKNETMILASTQTQSMLMHDADARHSLVGQDLPSYALLQRCESTSFTCCGFGGKQQIGDKKQNRNGSRCLGKPAILSMISGMFIRKEQGVGSLCPKAIGAHIFMLRNRMKFAGKKHGFCGPNFILLPTTFRSVSGFRCGWVNPSKHHEK